MEIPTREEIARRIGADIRAHFLNADVTTPGTGFTEIKQILAPFYYGFYVLADYVLKQFFADTADEVNLLRMATLYLEVPRIPASFASGTASIAGTDATVVPFNTRLIDSNGVEFLVQTEATIAAGVATLNLLAVDAGEAANLPAGTTLSFVSPISGVDGDATLDAGGTAGGADLETIDRVRERLKERLLKNPEGGAEHDYVAWAKAAHPDVTRVFVFPHENGTGSIVVRVVTDDDGVIASQPVLDAVTAYIDAVKPANLKALAVETPTQIDFDVTFTALSPNTTAVQDAITAELTDLLKRKSEPGGTLYLSHIREAISRAAGEEDFTISAPAANIVYADDEIGVLGTITFP